MAQSSCDRMSSSPLTDRASLRGLTVAAALALVVSSASAGPRPRWDVRRNLEVLGAPTHERYGDEKMTYARNVWDMQVFDGKLYLGSGNGATFGPATDPGPADVWYFDPASDRFKKPYTIDGMQIDRYRVIGAKLMIPGHTPLESWDTGNFYVLESGGWEKKRTLPDAMHNYDLLRHRGRLFAALGTPEGAGVAVSTNLGRSWKLHHMPGMRSYTLARIGTEIYASNFNTVLCRFTGKGFERVEDVEMFPAAPEPHPEARQGTRLMVRPVVFRSRAVYIGADSVNDQHWHPFAIYSAGVIGGDPMAEKIPIDGVPWDLLLGERHLYALTAEIVEDRDTHPYLVRVWYTADLKNWQEVMHFRCQTFARSFELLDGDFYFGLGCGTDTPWPAQTGQILRVKGEHFALPK